MDRSRPWDYQPSGVIQSLCTTNLYVSFQTSEDRQQQQAVLRRQADQSTVTGSTLQGIYASSTIILSTLRTQAQVQTTNQIIQYQRFPPVCIPSSVIQTDQISQTTGIPIQPFQFQDCKGNTWGFQ
jgi:hypothetical protein